MLSEGKGRPVWRPSLASLAVAGCVYLMLLGGFVTVRALIEWLA